MISGEGSFQPVLVEKDGQTYMVVYTSAEAAQKTRGNGPVWDDDDRRGRWVRRLSPNLGLVVSSGKGDLALEARFLQSYVGTSSWPRRSTPELDKPDTDIGKRTGARPPPHPSEWGHWSQPRT